MSFYDLTNWFYVFVRVSAFMVALPVFTASPVPMPVRIALSAATALVISPLLPATPPLPTGLWQLLCVLFGEAGVGLLLGFVCRFVFFAVEFAGGLLSTEMGLTMSSALNPLAASSTSIPGMIL